MPSVHQKNKMSHSLDYTNPLSYKTYESRHKKKFSGSTMIPEQVFRTLINMECFYCGKPAPNGIDRRDNSKGYIKGNCVACCKHCNYAKGDLSEEVFKIWIQRLVKNTQFNLI